MKTKRIVQWVVFVAVSLAVLVAGGSLLGLGVVAFMGYTAASLLMCLIVGLGYGAVWAYLTVTVGLMLAERGWFV